MKVTKYKIKKSKELLAIIVSIFLLMTTVAVAAKAARFKGEVRDILPANTTIDKVITTGINFIKQIKQKNTKEYGIKVIIIDAKLPMGIHQGERFIIHSRHGKMLAKVITIVTPKTSIGTVEKIFKHKEVMIIINDLKHKRAVVLHTRKELNLKKQQKVLIFIQRVHRTMMEGC